MSRLVWMTGQQYEAVKRAQERLDKEEYHPSRVEAQDSDRLQQVIRTYESSRGVNEPAGSTGFVDRPIER